MSQDNKNSHLTYDERKIIETGIEHGSTKQAIADTIGKDNSTVGKEIKLHRQLVHKCSYSSDCKLFQKCPHDRICDDCPDHSPFKCKRRDRSPGACNGCDKFNHCRYDKYRYLADIAEKEYNSTLVLTRLGINMTYNELKDMAAVIIPLVKLGQSPYQIITNHPELNICEKTLYNYIETGVFREFGLQDIDLRAKVKRKIPKSVKTKYKKREDKKYLKGRTYKDFKNYTEENPDLCVVQMDTVYNNGSTGPFMQTFKFIDYSFMLIIYHDIKTSEEMTTGVDLLESILGHELFVSEVAIILTDRGAEFVDAEGIEKEINGSRRTRVFYCDPMASGQKGSLENNHKEIRYICPKETDLRNLGLTDQSKANKMASHINSQPKKVLKGKSPIEMMKFLKPELYERLKAFGIEEINKDEIILKPHLLK